MNEKKKQWSLIGIFVILIAGIVVLLYPVVSNIIQKQTSSASISSYKNQVKELDEEEIERSLAQARAYNQTLIGSVLSDPFDNEAAKQAAKNVDILNVGESMGYIEIPKIDVSLPIFQGTSEKVLTKGVGLLENTSLPIGGKGTHAVLCAHRGLPSAKFFDDVDRMKKGDVFYIHILNQTLAYEVNQILTVLPQEGEALAIDSKEDYATLLTCTPYGVNTHRLLVRGTRIPYVEAKENASGRDSELDVTDRSRGKYVLAALGIFTVILVGIILMIVIFRKRKEKAQKRRGRRRRPKSRRRNRRR